MADGPDEPTDAALRPTAALVVVVWPGRLELPVLGDRAIGRHELEVIATYASGHHETIHDAAAAATGDPDDEAFVATSQALAVWRGLAAGAGSPRPLTPARPRPSTAGSTEPGSPPGDGDGSPDDDRAWRVVTPLSVRPAAGGFEIAGHHGELLVSLRLDELLVLPDLGLAAPLDGTHPALAAHPELGLDELRRLAGRLRAAGLLVPADPSSAVTRSPEDTRARVRVAFAAAADRADAAEDERRARTGIHRTLVVPVSFTYGPPLALGLIVANAIADADGRLTDRYDFRCDWEWDDDRLERYTSEPVVVLASVYVWSHAEVLRVVRAIKARSPASVVVAGGPDAPKREEAAARYLADHPEVDVVVRGEGERTAVELLAALRRRDHPDGRPAGFDLEPLTDVAGLTVRLGDRVVRSPDRERMADLDVVPSPFLTGLFDTYREAPLDQVVLESNRGCPYGCTFCDWGSATQSRIRQFALDRVLAEIDWCATAGAKVVSFADANFGIFARDVDIAAHVTRRKAETSYPRGFGANFAKNTVKHLRPIIRTLVDGGIVNRGLLALQTTDEETLGVIERSNIRTERYDAIAAEMRAAGLPFAVELMMGLPGATVESFKADLQQCIDREVEGTVNPTSVLVNSPMNDPAYRARHGIETAVEVGPGAHALVVASASFTREDYDHMRALRRTFLLGENFGVTRHVDRLIRHATGRREIDVLEQLHADVVGDRHGRARHPHLAALLGQPSPTLVIPVSWRFVVDDLVSWVRWRHPEVDPDALATVARVQHALLPALDRDYPDVVELDHDYASWFALVVEAKEAGHLADWPDRVPPLTSFGPGTLHVDDPNRSARDNLGCSVDHGPLLATWEHRSEVGRALFLAAAPA